METPKRSAMVESVSPRRIRYCPGPAGACERAVVREFDATGAGDERGAGPGTLRLCPTRIVELRKRFHALSWLTETPEAGTDPGEGVPGANGVATGWLSAG